MPKVLQIFFLTISVASLSACAPDPIALEGLGSDVFAPEPLYSGRLLTVGDLASGFVTNTTALERANNKLTTICIAAGRCATEQRVN